MHVFEIIAEVAVTKVFEKERHCLFFHVDTFNSKNFKGQLEMPGLIMDLGTIGFDIQE